MIYFGVDPGASGAIAAIDDLGTVLDVCRFSKVSSEGQIGLLMHQFLSAFEGPRLLAIEKVHSMPQQSSQSTFTFGFHYGESYAAAVICKVPLEAVRPQKWQKDLGLLSKPGESKTEHKRRMKEFAATRWARKVVADEADAMLIAEWLRIHSNRSHVRS